MTGYVLTEAAEADLHEIVRYTRDAWGAVQAKRYVGRLENSFEILAAPEGRFRIVDALYPGLRMVRCGHHFVFCFPRDDAPALIVAILHKRMAIMARLASRLDYD